MNFRANSRRLEMWLAAVAGLGVAASLSGAAAAAPEVDFQRDIRPILANHCFECHGPDDQARQADLRLDTRAGATTAIEGRVAVAAGEPEKSELIRRIRASDPATRMPPADFGKPLSAEQRDLLARWIEQGAPYFQHWSFEPIRRPALPSVRHPEQAGNAIDTFLLARLDAIGVDPSPAADRATLIRRVHLDVLGTPPTIAEVERFLRDTRPDAYAQMVDRALASPRLGERWGRHWLDQARYADSHGYTNDNERLIWPYRDWVIRAFNRDLPFDQFTIEQLAGDLLESPTIEQRVATGFHRNTLINSEGGTKADQFRDEQVKDRADTTGVVWMGLTVGCAKCHTHKYDPLLQSEYYQLYAFFNSTADSNSVTPTLATPSESQTRRLAELDARGKQLAAQLKGGSRRAARQAAWEASLPEQASRQGDGEETFAWTVLELSGKSQQGSKLTSLEDRSLLVSGEPRPEEEYHATAFSPLTKIRSVRLEVLTDPSLPQQGPGRADNGNFVLSEFWFRTGDGRELRFSAAFAEHSQPKYDVSASIDGKTDTGWAINGAPEGALNRNRSAWFVLPEPLEVELEHALVFKMQFHHDPPTYSIGRFRISVSPEVWEDRPDASNLAVLAAISPAERSPGQQAKLDAAFLAQDSELAPVQRELQQATKAHEELKRSIPVTMVLEELEHSRPTHLQIRGDFLRTGEAVTPGVPAALPPLPAGSPPDRLALARWLMSDEHPLTARVRVNRMWMRLFGRGIVETENDFGIQSSLPTHPQLLDWLADEFIRGGWSTKRLLRLMLNSSAYRQASHARPDLQTVDPRNLLLARQSRLRVEAEIVRDLALSVSGQLATTIGGPSVYPPQPAGVYAFTQRDKNWRNDLGEGRFRRGIYTFFYRSAPYPMFSTFDVPKFNATCTRRDRSNTPLQSLTVSNSEAMFELAAHLGRRLAEVAVSDGADADRQRLTHGFRLCFSREPTPRELALLEDYLRQSRLRFPVEHGEWTAVARVLINLDAFITRE